MLYHLLARDSFKALAISNVEFKKFPQIALSEENTRWTSERKLTVEVKEIENRPIGTQPENVPIIQIAATANRFFNLKKHFNASCTDSNVPISLNIPAITIAGGSDGSTGVVTKGDEKIFNFLISFEIRRNSTSFVGVFLFLQQSGEHGKLYIT